MANVGLRGVFYKDSPSFDELLLQVSSQSGGQEASKSVSQSASKSVSQSVSKQYSKLVSTFPPAYARACLLLQLRWATGCIEGDFLKPSDAPGTAH